MHKYFKLFSAAFFSVLLIISSDAFAQYKPGTYKGSAVGRSDKKHSGEIEVEVKVNEKGIEEIKVLKYDQSVDHKKYGKAVVKAEEEVPANMTKKNSVDVDVISGATMSSIGLNLAVAKALEKASLNKYKAGTYKGASVGRSDKKHSGEIEVEVTVSENAITDIKVSKYDQSTDHKKYGKPVNEAKEKTPAAIVKGQSIDVDVISKATMSTSGIQLAVAKALEKARVK
ncbi:MAG: FMN-binding protein [Ignavibacteriae bacterium]|nr:FMN-binding protein [Ignavibacteriota bacterium]NOG97978.1 FMN-binding protein [Ignavibacteriota bacterium]